MTTVLALDPGLRRSGVAAFCDGQLVAASCLTASANGSLLGRVREMSVGVRWWLLSQDLALVHLVAEWPQVYQRGAGRTRGNPNDVVPLAAVVGAVAAHLDRDGCLQAATTYAPAEWKGQVPKDVMRGRIEGRLSDDERAVVGRRLPHDGWDAIGIGLHHLGRLERRRAP